MAIRAYVNGRTLKAMSDDYSDALIRGEAVTLLPAIPNVSWVVVDGEPSMADDEADVNDAPRFRLTWQDSNGSTGSRDLAPIADASIFADTFEAYRQQGREEVLRELARYFERYKPLRSGRCLVCCSFPDTNPDHLYGGHTTEHCLWWRAQQAVK